MFRHFKLEEFACPCCGENLISQSFVKQLDSARSLAGVPFKINSGYRCAKHNASLPNSKPGSAHTLGLAADISAKTSRQRIAIVDALLMAGFNRIGISKTFVHADVDTTKPQKVMWLY